MKENVIREYIKRIVNAPFNLTAIKDENLAYYLLALDSLIPLEKIKLEGNFLDVGTGGGVPGVFIGIAFKHMKGLLVDASRKKVDYIRNTCRMLGINNLEFLHGRIEEQKNLKGTFDNVFSRAVAELRVILELTVPFAKVGGRVFLYKGREYLKELENAKNAIEVLKVELTEIVEYNILNKNRVLLIFEKKESVDKFPRRYNKILKSPL
ncbi:16S rRNA methyltransferase [Thermosipho affectus]|uniref:Ribosomal RNA small subunit methyltransferase G n=1 Tax=Thermosipho affectus TaxID=660294 RepID=A0ABX3IHA2_9BACT|nr:16S rRNA (guanine(527)-N(7))-methyltransferase RsmG [Thermosipho affectus]ONN26689.1 16S rRNA methyltransferase [Thermosipho affectus]